MKNSPVGLVYTDNFAQYDFGEGHPLTPIRIELTYSLMKAYGLLDSPKILKLNPRSATEEELLRVHTPRFISKLKELNSITTPDYHAYPEFGLGPGDNPVFPGMYDAAKAVVGASLTAMEYLFNHEDNERVFNITGGLHHALPDTASGFCIFNDAAVSIQRILDIHPDFRVMYLDIDCHHGDGVQWIFYKNPRVLKFSLHQNGNTLFPGTGFPEENGEGPGLGYSLNFPFPPHTFDMIYLRAFNRILPQVMDAYRPDILVTQLGVDTHFTDPLTQMGLTTGGQEKVFKKIHELVPKYTRLNKLLALGGGGYDVSVVARTWTMILAEMMGVEIADPLPESWLNHLRKVAPNMSRIQYLRDNNWKAEEMQLKNPYLVDEIEGNVDLTIDKFEKELIPRIKQV
jgi:acetoin utilization protein AcuC